MLRVFMLTQLNKIRKLDGGIALLAVKLEVFVHPAAGIAVLDAALDPLDVLGVENLLAVVALDKVSQLVTWKEKAIFEYCCKNVRKFAPS